MMRFLKPGLTITVAAVFGIAIVLFLFTFTVRFTEVAVPTRFGQAREPIRGTQNPGLHFKLPYPIDSITKYDTRSRLVQLRKEAQQTADNRQVIVEAFCIWNVDDPIKFYERFSSEGERTDVQFDAAADAIKTRLRTAVGEISRYRIDELFSVDDLTGDHPRLAALEDEIMVALKTPTDEGQTLEQLTGVSISAVGISSIVLPQETSAAVFKRMEQDRRTLVNEITSQAQSEAEAIKSAAEADRDRIQAFTQVRASEIRSQGDLEAEGYLSQMNEHPGLAVFLESVDFIRDIYARKVTLVLSTDETHFQLLDLNAMSHTSPDGIPGIEGHPGLEVARDDPRDDEPEREVATNQVGGGQ